MKVRLGRNIRSWRETLTPVIRGVGILLHVPAGMALLMLCISLIFAEYDGIRVSLITALASIVSGQSLYWLVHQRERQPVLASHAMLIAALAWLLISLLGAVPYIMTLNAHALDAMFESMSGFTGTGLSLFNPENMPHYLQWWRSLTQWVGGVGVVLLMLSVLSPQRGVLELYYSEARSEKLLPSVRATARLIWSIYGALSLLAVILLWLVGLPLWQAINHGMTAIATGGFTITQDSLVDAPIAVKVAYVPIMLAGAISFYSHYRVWSERTFKPWWNDSQYHLFWILIASGAVVVTLNDAWFSQAGVLDSGVQWIAAITTTGVRVQELSIWHPGTLFLMALVMCVGGIAGSTTGGIKMLRLVLLYKSVVWNVIRILRKPHQLIRLSLDGKPLTDTDAETRVRAATTLVVAWVLTTLVAVFAMTYCVPSDTPLHFIVFDVLSAQSGEGLTTGLVHEGMTAGAKIILMTVMWMGRLEIIPVLVLIMVLLNRSIRIAT